MTLEDLGKSVRMFMSSPLRSMGLLALLVGMVAVGSWINSYASKKGERSAERSGAVTITSIRVGALGPNNVVDVVFDNKTGEEALITNVVLSASYMDDNDCCCPPLETMTVSANVAVDDAGHATGTVKSADHLTVSAEGKLEDNHCGDASLLLRFPASVGLAKEALGSIRIAIPKTLLVGSNMVEENDASADEVNPLKNRRTYPVKLEEMNLTLRSTVNGKQLEFSKCFSKAPPPAEINASTTFNPTTPQQKCAQYLEDVKQDAGEELGNRSSRAALRALVSREACSKRARPEYA